MEVPINIVVESPSGEQAELVGRAIAHELKHNFGFEQVVNAHIVTDSPGFRAWRLQVEEVKEQTLLDAMRAHNPGIFQAPITVLSRENRNSAEGEVNSLPRLSDVTMNSFSLGGIGETGVMAKDLHQFASARDEAGEAMRQGLVPKLKKTTQKDVEDVLEPNAK